MVAFYNSCNSLCLLLPTASIINSPKFPFVPFCLYCATFCIYCSYFPGRLLATMKGHSGHITDLQVSPDNAFVVSASTDKTVRVWDFTGASVTVLLGHTEDVLRISFSPVAETGRARFLVSASLDGTCRIWNCLNFQAPPIILTHSIPPQIAATLPADL